jgi:hypothetical protein
MDRPERRAAVLRWINTETSETSAFASAQITADDIKSCRDAISPERRRALIAIIESNIARAERVYGPDEKLPIGEVNYMRRNHEALAVLQSLGAH